MRKTRLYANRNHALTARKQAAKMGPGEGFGFEALATQDFFDDAWTIWGDARKLITPLERSLLVWKLLGEQQVLGHTLGTAHLLEGFLEQAAGLFEATLLTATATTSETLKNAVKVLAVTYYESVRELGLIEAGDAAAVLAQVMPKTTIELGEYVDLLPAQRKLLESWNVDLSLLETLASLEPLDVGVKPTFLVAAGATAVPGLIKDEIESYLLEVCGEIKEAVLLRDGDGGLLALNVPAVSQLEDLAVQEASGMLAKMADDAAVLSSVLVLVKQPGELFRALSRYFNTQGIVCTVEESVCFIDTWVGKACLAVWQILHKDEHWLLAATDFAYNPLSAMTPYAAETLNTTYRGDRRLTVEDVCCDLEQQSTFSLFKALLTGDISSWAACVNFADHPGVDRLTLINVPGDKELCLEDGLREVIASSIPFNERDQELAMLEALLEFVRTTWDFGLGVSEIFDMLQELKITNAQETSVSGSSFGRVTFASLAATSKVAEKSYGLVVVGDVSSEAFVLAESHSSLETFAAQLGVELDLDPLQVAYRQFMAAEKAASRQFTCVFSNRNEAFEEAFASSIYDEYRELFASAEYVEDASEMLDSSTKYRGEERINEGLGLHFSPMEGAQTYSEVTRGKLLYSNVLDYLSTVDEEDVKIPVLSASAIESYLNCPYQWFIKHGLGCSSLDEGFDNRTKGTFVHEVFATLFGQLKAQGLRLSEEVVRWDGLFDQVFDEVRDRQWERAHDRLIPLTEVQRQEIELLRGILRRNLQLQMGLPGEYLPEHFEYKIAADDGVDYAGARLRGSVDRIDVNPETGDFVVLDYKSNSSKHAAPFEASKLEGAQELGGNLLPAYVQSLIYAQAIRRKGFTGTAEAEFVESGETGALDPRCAGALYLGYKAKNSKKLLEGSYDQSRYKVTDYVGANSQVKGDMGQFLDVIEQGLVPYVKALVAGDIAGAPRGSKSCQCCLLSGRGACKACSKEDKERNVCTNALTVEWEAE